MMAADIDIQAFEREWAFPACDRIKTELDKYDPEDRPLKLLSLTWRSLNVSAQNSNFHTFSWISGTFYHDALAQLFKVYGEKYREINPHCFGEAPGENDVKSYIVKLFPEKNIDDIFLHHDGIDQEEFAEFLLEYQNIDWIRQTSMYDLFNLKVSEIYSLHKDLSERVEKRKNIDILN
jgi:hypothetical protein